jgi:hypothetical protein
MTCKLICLAVLVAVLATVTASAAPWKLDIDAASFTRYHLMDPEGNGLQPPEVNLIPTIKRTHRLGGEGWVDYDFAVPTTGWYQLSFTQGESVDDHDFFVDGTVHLYGGFRGKISNLWLSAGKHTLRAQRFTWSGLANVAGFTITKSDESLAQSVRVQVVPDRLIFRQGEKLDLDLYSGDRRLPAALRIDIKRVSDDKAVGDAVQVLPAGVGLEKTRVSLPCTQEGVFYLTFSDGNQPISPRDVREIEFVVIDTTMQPRTGGELKKTLLREIDCTKTPPEGGFWSSGGATRVVQAPFGSYRESGDHGYLQNNADASFFAYKLDVPEIQRPYLIEVDYPDDAQRTYCIGLEEGNNMDYPPAGGVDSGGEFSLSHSMQTQSFLHWPRTKEQRVLFYNAQNGRRAAAAKIRLYRIDGDLPALPVPVNGGRSFGYWLEEGDRWATFQGAPDKTLVGHLVSMQRWAEAAAYMGADTLNPTLCIYQNILFPSSHFDGYFRVSGGPRDPMTLDLTRMLLLVCEKHGLKLLPDFHPTWNGYKRQMVDDAPYAKDPDPKPQLMVSRDGMTGSSVTEPYFNPIYPANADWYVRMLGEFCDRYADSPALRGVSLRVMGWVWESRNGWPSLNWGYEDYTVNLFSQETGVQIPVAQNDPQRFQKRYAWLMAHARDKWVQWRCDQITALYERISERVRRSRRDLVTDSAVHGPQMDYGYYKADAFTAKLDRDGFRENYLEAGYDPNQLGALGGVTFFNAQHYYGRRQQNDYAEQVSRDMLLEPQALDAFRGQTGEAGYLFGNSYFEADEVVHPDQFGLPNTKPGGFVGVVNPAGRHYLERYALALAEGDATTILDGGEGYLLGQAQYLHEFLSEYRNLPRDRFLPRMDARDPVAVWALRKAGKFYFYAVNRERFPVRVAIHLGGTGAVRRLSTGEVLTPADGNVINLSLDSYQLMAFKAPGSQSIASVVTVVPPEALARVRAQVTWLQQLARDVEPKTVGESLSDQQRHDLATMAAAAGAALQAGHVWRARTLMENHLLLQIYDAALRYPPFLRDVKAPAVPPQALRVPDLAQIAQAPGGQVQTLASDTVSALWSGDQVLATTAPRLDLKLEMPVANRYRFTLGYASGGEYGPLQVSLGGAPLGLATDGESTPHAAATVLPKLVPLAAGAQTLSLQRLAGSRTAVYFLDVVPVYHDITAQYWSVIGSFPSLSELKQPGDGLAKVYPPEVKRDFSAVVPLGNGKTARWERFAGNSDYLDFFAKYHLYSTGISYAVTYIYSPVARPARLSYGVDYWAKLWLNGALVKDLSQRPYAPQKGQFTLDVPLKAGWNELLVKVHSGGSGNGFWMAISDPGDLKFAAQPPQ